MYRKCSIDKINNEFLVLKAHYSERVSEKNRAFRCWKISVILKMRIEKSKAIQEGTYAIESEYIND